ncbi:M48 family metallopeptidase [Tropicimonas sp. IMCC34011]|uniref:M48 family metallopeptidase n=1 Tax=Tropicimonas sp. IMCC34011 TaxID=2248759 RepID=UPI000E222153|nr:M48 family metallopeptidase [Tropicimonas sp. IMCC34011]
MTGSSLHGQTSVPALFHDGRTAGERAVRAVADAGSGRMTILAESGAPLAIWPLKDVRQVRDPGSKGHGVFHLSGTDEARLVVEAARDVAALAALCPNRKASATPPGTARRILVRGVAAIGAILLILFVILPRLSDTIARMIPPDREEQIGTTVVAQVERAFGARGEDAMCSTAEGDAALQKMRDRLIADLDVPYDVKIRVLDSGMVNAFAAPGGHVVIFSALIYAAESPEEVAGILAHELGHVASRDPLRLTLRAAGSAGILSLVIGDFAGGAAAAVIAEQVASAAYTREAEAAADRFAFDMLAAAELPSEAIAQFFDRLREEHGDMGGVLEYVASHPSLAGRAEAARSAETQGDAFAPVLSEEEWQSLRAICDLPEDDMDEDAGTAPQEDE